jgi:hypothetical protein
MHIPLLVSPLLDQNHLRDALYRLMTMTPATTFNDDIIGVYGKRYIDIGIPAELQEQYQVIRYPINIDEPQLQLSENNTDWINVSDLTHNDHLVAMLRQYDHLAEKMEPESDETLITRRFPVSYWKYGNMEVISTEYWFAPTWGQVLGG